MKSSARRRLGVHTKYERPAVGVGSCPTVRAKLGKSACNHQEALAEACFWRVQFSAELC